MRRPLDSRIGDVGDSAPPWVKEWPIALDRNPMPRSLVRPVIPDGEVLNAPVIPQHEVEQVPPVVNLELCPRAVFVQLAE